MSSGRLPRVGKYALRRFRQAATFAAAARPFLIEREASNCLQLGLIGGIQAGEWNDPFLALVERYGKPALVAMRTPPHNLLLSHTDDLATIRLLVNELKESLGGVLGPQEVADYFAKAWGEAAGVRPTLIRRQRIYRLERVEPVSGVKGAARVASADDRELLELWMADFLSEALADQKSDAAGTVERWLASAGRELWFWEVSGEPVAMAGVGSRTPNGVRISAVYTPSECRRRGFASALVGRLSRLQLDLGRRFCFLFTDLENPTSNHIYQRLGYQPVSDAHEYIFLAQ